MSALTMTQYASACNELKTTDQILVGLIFIFGGPFFVIANILEVLLDNILPEGWDDTPHD